MEIYFVRHGETGGNVAHRHQADKTPLSAAGLAQAKTVAIEVKGFQPTHILTSPLVRAVETAREIGRACDLIPETNSDFAELERPKRMYGRYHLSLSSLWFYGWWFLGLSREGESYRTLRERIVRAKANFNEYPADARVVVVSHSVFINMFLVHMCRDRALGPFQAVTTFKNIITMKNTTCITLRYDTVSGNTCPWAVVDE